MSLKSSVRDWFIRRELNNQAKEKTMIGKIWAWFDGKKTLIGAVLTILGTVAEQLSVILPVLLEPAQAAQYVGVATAVLGGLHKIYKFIYKTDVPKG
jgi:hypothetical protein